MYIDFFGFKEKPFRLTPEPSSFYCSPNHDRAVTMLEYGINSRKGFMLFYGLPGSGKTTLCFLLRETLVNCNVSYIAKTSDKELFSKICGGFGITVNHNINENEFFGLLMDYFVSEYKKGRNNLIIVDDADEYSVDIFRVLEKLSEVEIEQCKLVQVLVVGTQELCNKLKYGNVKDISERMLSVTELNLLSLNDTANYLQHRLKMAKSIDPDIIKRTAVIEIFRYSHGLPLEINLVADKAFDAAAEAKDKKVGPKHVRSAIKQISGIRAPLKVVTLSQYMIPVLVVLVLLLGGMLVKTFLHMKNMEEQYAGTLITTDNLTNDNTEKSEPVSPVIDPASVQTPTESADTAQPKQEQPEVTETENKMPAETPTPTAPEKKYGCITARSGLKLRQTPDPNGEMVSLVPFNSTVSLYERDGKWWKAEFKGSEGYLFRDYVVEGECK